MKKITLVAGLALALVLPTVAGAKPNPDNGDRRAAKAECRTLRGGTDATREAFLTRFRNFGACVRRKAVEEAVEEQTAHKNAAQECRAEREADPVAFRDWGTNPNGKNAFGKCVSSKAKENEAEADEQDQQNAEEFKNAAKECDAERDTNPDFATTYGSENANFKNAFGKCVSQKVREDDATES
jgi:Cu2+-containing amine oxidase